MIYIKIAMWPGGDQTRERLLGEGTIANVGGDASFGDYQCLLFKSPEYSKHPGDPARPKVSAIWKKGYTKRFPRSRLGPWDLLFRCLLTAVGSRNKEL